MITEDSRADYLSKSAPAVWRRLAREVRRRLGLLPREPRFIFTLTTGHSGGTLLNLLLGTSPAIFPAGESLRVYKLNNLSTQSDTVQLFWKDALHRLSKEGYAPPELTEEFVKSAPVSFWRLWVGILAGMSDAPVIADKSLSLRTIRSICDSGIVTPYFVHLTRDPRAVVFSYSRKSGATWRHAQSWNNSHRAIEKYLKGRRNFCRVRYEDLVSGPSQCVQRILTEAGKSFDLDLTTGTPRDLEERKLDDPIFENVIFAGNRMRYEDYRKDARITADTAFEQQMSMRDWAITNAYCARRMVRYGYATERPRNAMDGECILSSSSLPRAALQVGDKQD